MPDIPPSPPSDRVFDPSKRPATDALRALVAAGIARTEQHESRVRQRKAAAQAIFEAVVAAVVCDLVHAELGELEGPGPRLMVPMAKAELTKDARPAPFMTEAFADTVKLLAAADVVDLQLGYRAAFGGRQSTIGPGRWLLDQLRRVDVDFSDIGRDPALLPVPVVLRPPKTDGGAKSLPLPVTEETQRLIAEMATINAWIREADLTWTGEPVDTGARHLIRIFNDGAYDRGGRLYRAFWLQAPSEQRTQHLRINNQPVATLDFAQMGIRIAYGLVEAELPAGDLYRIPGTGGSREGVKQVLGAMLAADKQLTRFPAGTKRLFPSGRRFEGIRDAIYSYHAPLRPLFGTAQALAIQNRESRVMVTSLLRLREQGVVALPIHDAVLVGVSHVSIAKQTLETVFEELTGIRGEVRVEPSPNTIGKSSVPPMKGA